MAKDKPIKATRKQRKVLELLAANSSISTAKAIRMAGYANSMARRPSVITQSDGFVALAEKYLPTDRILEVAGQGLNADKVIRYKGQEFTDPDYYARHLYLQTALKIRGLAQTADTPIGDVNIQVINYKDTPLADKPFVDA